MPLTPTAILVTIQSECPLRSVFGRNCLLLTAMRSAWWARPAYLAFNLLLFLSKGHRLWEAGYRAAPRSVACGKTTAECVCQTQGSQSGFSWRMVYVGLNASMRGHQPAYRFPGRLAAATAGHARQRGLEIVATLRPAKRRGRPIHLLRRPRSPQQIPLHLVASRGFHRRPLLRRLHPFGHRLQPP